MTKYIEIFENTISPNTRKGVPLRPYLIKTEVINDAGGMINSQCAGTLPKSHQQISYYQYKEKSQKELGYNFNILYNIKTSNPGKEFLRTGAAAPELMVVLATNHQLDDMVRFLKDPVDFSIMGVDSNFGDFNVMPTVLTYFWSTLQEVIVQ